MFEVALSNSSRVYCRFSRFQPDKAVYSSLFRVIDGADVFDFFHTSVDPFPEGEVLVSGLRLTLSSARDYLYRVSVDFDSVVAL